jgi:tetratricopeptide (TPR) repeat protein
MKHAPGDIAALVNASRALFNQNDAVGAERVLSPVIAQLRSDPAALHLMGLVKRALNDNDEAERYFRSAIAHSFDEGAYYNDLGVVLQAKGQYEEALKVYRAALALAPQAAATRVNLVHCLLAFGDLHAAEQEARTYIAVAPSPEAWTLLGQVQREQGKYEEAIASAEAALGYNPQLRGLRLNHATALDRAGRSKEALEIYEKLARVQIDSAELALNFGRALFAAGRPKEAEAVLEEGASRYPGNISIHSTLARVRWLRGEGEAATAPMEQAIAARPSDLNLRLACADALHRGGHPQKALTVLHEALRLAPDTPALLTAFGIVLDELDRPRDGLKALRRVVELQPDSPSAKRNLLSTLVRAGQPEEALAIIRTLRAKDQDEQYLIACEALALRVLGHPGYREFYDYDRFVRSYEIAPPRSHFTIQNFNASLADVLREQHRSNAHPLDQHIHNGSQTGRSLLALNDPTLTAFIRAVDEAVRDYISRLKADDPVGRRRRERSRYASLWSVRLSDGGYQPNHVHDRGWISSAYYVALLPNEKPRDPHAGWLKLGEPNRPVANTGPERLIEPKLGVLVLFPSYMWHGTVPFEGSERLSLAFDVIPS